MKIGSEAFRLRKTAETELGGVFGVAAFMRMRAWFAGDWVKFGLTVLLKFKNYI